MSRQIRSGMSKLRAKVTAPARQRRRLAIAAICATAGMLLTACSAAGSGGAAAASSASQAAGGQLSITPANGSTHATTDQGITVTAAHGKITNVTVRTAGDTVTGSLNSAGTVWHSNWALGVSQSYTVTAAATGRRPEANPDQLVPHVHACPDSPDHDLRGLPADLRRRDADHPHLQPPRRQQGGGRKIPPAPHV